MFKYISLAPFISNLFLRYCLKPEDRLTFGIDRDDYGENEVDWWRDAQVIGPYKAMYKIFNANCSPKHSPFNLYNQTPQVMDLALHLQNNQHVRFHENASTSHILVLSHSLS